MTNGWLDPAKYERLEITGCTGPGTMKDGYAWKSVFHTTESPPGSIDGVLALFKAQPCYCPHFTIDPVGSGRRVQHIPWGWSAAALKGGAGGYETNRGRAVQMEICTYSQDSRGWSDDVYWQIADVVADLIKDGCPIDPDVFPDYPSLSGTLATSTAPQRFNWEQWKLFPGLAAHVVVPNNDHWDWGYGNASKVSAYVHQILAGQSITIVPGPPATPLPPAPPMVRVGFIAKGMTGGVVSFIQDLLIGLGYSVGVTQGDGVFGIQTELAVKAFQRDHQLIVDGVVGPQTNAAISAAYASVSTKPVLPAPVPPSTGYPVWPGRFFVVQTPLLFGGDIKVWQTQMAARGWPIEADGWYGPASGKVCYSFEVEKGLTADSVVGPQCWAAAWSSPIS